MVYVGISLASAVGKIVGSCHSVAYTEKRWQEKLPDPMKITFLYTGKVLKLLAKY
jgi:hypothetical protein